MIAVKTKPRLKTNSNIALGCLAVTDVLMGVIGQPIFAAIMILTQQGDSYNEHCTLQRLSKIVIRSLGAASIRHLVLINVERFIAIRHSFAYTTMLTKARILGSSVLAWITVVFTNLPLLIAENNIFLTINNILLCHLIASIVFCQLAVYGETRRHEKQIAAQQVTVEARQKFLKEKKALKLTTIDYYAQAEQFERRMFRTSNIVAPLAAGQKREEAQNKNQGNPNNNGDDDGNTEWGRQQR
ncbi:hypothetical protein ACROYT_G033430 [Oculina patagonica]